MSISIRNAIISAVFWGSVFTAIPYGNAAIDSASAYQQLSTVQTIRGRINLLSRTILLPSADYVYVQSDGRYCPGSGGAAANVYIEIDGERVSNDAVIDWRGSTNGQQHSFNAIGTKWLAAGSHTVQLVAESLSGLVSTSINSDGDIIAMASGRAYASGRPGDAINVINLRIEPRKTDMGSCFPHPFGSPLPEGEGNERPILKAFQELSSPLSLWERGSG